MNHWLRARLALVTTVAALAAACASPPPVDAALARDVEILGSEETTTIAAILDGRAGVVNFWASWCEFCIAEMPDLEAVWTDVSDQVIFVGVDREDRLDLALELAEETGVTYPLVEDPDGSLFLAARGLGMPTTLFVTPGGQVVFRHSGPLTEAQLRDLIAEHLDVAA
ncbi:MAG: TlpA disulfide reductase family protein [Nitriliruptorales bacterium]|nr:TlpA disulfide reductase family protein [Nitriliruptorales bacterium]